LPLFPFVFSLFTTQSQGAGRRYGRTRTTGKMSICTVYDTKYMFEGMRDRRNLFHPFSDLDRWELHRSRIPFFSAQVWTRSCGSECLSNLSHQRIRTTIFSQRKSATRQMPMLPMIASITFSSVHLLGKTHPEPDFTSTIAERPPKNPCWSQEAKSSSSQFDDNSVIISQFRGAGTCW
jgi:hypothetical protein